MIMDGFARRREQSKEEIRRAAWELFGQFGVDKVSVADIARKAGVSQATIYNNFGSKEALAREFVTASVEDLVNRFQEILAAKRSYREKMEAFFQGISAILEAGKSSSTDTAVFTGSLDLLNDPEIKRIREEAQEKMTGLLLGLVKEGRQQKQVNPDVSEAALRIYFQVYMDVFTHPEFQRQYHQHPRIVQEMGSLMIHGLSGKRK
jgi:AcrR family transcriptional regulator